MHRIAVCTDIGPRETLEDAAIGFEVACGASRGGVVLIVLDGVGGNACGEVASNAARAELAVGLMAYLSRPDAGEVQRDPADAVVDVLARSLRAANERILSCSARNRQQRGMATTVVVALLLDRTLFLGWAGDSRCYRFQQGAMELLTVDHTEVEPLIRAGQLSREEARDHPLAHRITNYLGRTGFEAQTRIIALEPEDVLLLCTDGLTDVLEPHDLAAALTPYQSGKGSFDDVPRRLIALARQRGTSDNTTCLCCEVPASHAAVRCPPYTLTGSYAAALAALGRPVTCEEKYHE